ncbi:MAG: hypothetical protein HYW48_02410 [Deltaproteobacteria bacterium]|nr:hypothetical protein [Deltaproteobacteria bacterium]
MNQKNLVLEKNYKIHAAGELWTVPEISFVRRENGQLMLTKEEIDRVNSSIANVLCSDETELTWDQFDFLCKTTMTKYSHIASMLRIDKSTVSKWKSGKLDYSASFVLKQFFWQKIFADHLNEKRADSIESQLKNMGKKAVDEKWTGRVSRAA